MTTEAQAALLSLIAEQDLDLLPVMGAAAERVAAGQIDDALALYKAWIDKNPNHLLRCAALFNRGALRNSIGDLAGAAEDFRESIRHDPTFLPPYVNLGNILDESGDRLGAVEQWRAVVDHLATVTREAVDMKRLALKQLGRVFGMADLDALAEEALQRSLELDMHQRDVIRHWYNLRQRQCRWPLLDPLPPAARNLVLEDLSPLSLASFKDDPLWQLAHAADFTRKEIGRPAMTLADRQPDARQTRLRIGYLSSDLWEHAVGYLTAEIYRLHDRSNVEVFAYYTGAASSDRIHCRIRDSVDHWCDLRALDDLGAAQRISDNGIDILVDLNGHTKDARTSMLACNPAPVIVNWLGFPGSMGSPFHHYIIADPFIIPPGSEMFYSEKVARLPCYQPIDRQRLVSDQRPGRADAGLPPDAMVFCCFNEPRKITEQTWRIWMEILAAVPDSVLWLLVPAETTQSHLRALAGQHGVDGSRLIFAPRRTNPDHLARYPLADLILDSFPYGAHTTASDALWMDVPVLTLAGRCFASRVCGSLLRAVGLDELITETRQDYVAKAIEIGRDREKRAALRRHLQQNRANCLLFDTPQLVRSLESLYQSMWQDFVRGARPKPDLANMTSYREIGEALAFEPEAEDYLGQYRRKLAERQHYSYLVPDSRAWPVD